MAYYSSPHTLSSSTSSKGYRCPTSDYKVSGTGLIDANKLGDFDVNVSEINDLYKKIEDAKRIVKIADNSIRSYTSAISSTSKNSKKQKYTEKKMKFESSRKIKDDEQRTLTRKAYSLISQQLKQKAIARTDRLTKEPEEGRLTKTACTLRALLQTLESTNCTNSSTSSYTPSSTTSSTSSTGAFKPTRESDLISQFTQRMNKAFPDYEDLAKAYIRAILENRKNATKMIQHIQLIDENFATVLKTMINDIIICSP